MASGSLARARWQAALACGGAALLAWRTPAPAVFALVAATLLMLAGAIFVPQRYAPVQRALDRAVGAVLAALSWALLALIYFGVFTPLRFVRAIAGGSWLARGPASVRTGSAFLTLPPPALRRFDRQF
jgi:hypothetical protein